MVDQPTTDAARLTAQDVRDICGDIPDWKLRAILTLEPTAGDVAAAIAWSNGQDELGAAGRPLEGVAAQVYDLLISDEDYGDSEN